MLIAFLALFGPYRGVTGDQRARVVIRRSDQTSSLSFNVTVCPTAKVGKTSLIMSLVGEEFPEEVCAIMDGSSQDD